MPGRNFVRNRFLIAARKDIENWCDVWRKNEDFRFWAQTVWKCLKPFENRLKPFETRLKNLCVIARETCRGCREFWAKAHHSKRDVMSIPSVVVLAREIDVIAYYRSGKVWSRLKSFETVWKSLESSVNFSSTPHRSLHNGIIIIHFRSRTAPCVLTRFNE